MHAERCAELSSAQRGWLAGPYFVSEVLVGGIAAVGDESYQSGPDIKRVSLGSCYPTLAAETNAPRGWGTPVDRGGRTRAAVSGGDANRSHWFRVPAVKLRQGIREDRIDGSARGIEGGACG